MKLYKFVYKTVSSISRPVTYGREIIGLLN